MNVPHNFKKLKQGLSFLVAIAILINAVVLTSSAPKAHAGGPTVDFTLESELDQYVNVGQKNVEFFKFTLNPRYDEYVTPKKIEFRQVYPGNIDQNLKNFRLYDLDDEGIAVVSYGSITSNDSFPTVGFEIDSYNIRRDDPKTFAFVADVKQNAPINAIFVFAIMDQDSIQIENLNGDKMYINSEFPIEAPYVKTSGDNALSIFLDQETPISSQIPKEAITRVFTFELINGCVNEDKIKVEKIKLTQTGNIDGDQSIQTVRLFDDTQGLLLGDGSLGNNTLTVNLEEKLILAPCEPHHLTVEVKVFKDSTMGNTLKFEIIDEKAISTVNLSTGAPVGIKDGSFPIAGNKMTVWKSAEMDAYPNPGDHETSNPNFIEFAWNEYPGPETVAGYALFVQPQGTNAIFGENDNYTKIPVSDITCSAGTLRCFHVTDSYVDKYGKTQKFQNNRTYEAKLYVYDQNTVYRQYQTEYIYFTYKNSSAKLPDLYVESIHQNTSSVYQNGAAPGTIYAKVCNIGEGDANGYDFNFSFQYVKNDGTLSKKAYYPITNSVLPAGSCTYPYMYPDNMDIPNSGDYTIVVEADSDNVIKETNENNNSLSKKIYIKMGGNSLAPDFVPIKIYFQKEADQSNAIPANSIVAKFCNKGTDKLSNAHFDTQFKYNGKVQTHGWGGLNLNVGECSRAFMGVPSEVLEITKTGTYEDIEVFVDSSDKIRESNESNNMIGISSLYIDLGPSTPTTCNSNDLSFNVGLTSNPAYTKIPMGEAYVDLVKGQKIVFTPSLKMSCVDDYSDYKWNYDKNYLDCKVANSNDIYSPLECRTKKTGNSTVSLSVSPVMSDGQVWSHTSVLVAVRVTDAPLNKEIPPAGFEDEVITAFDVYQNPFPDTNLNEIEGMAAAELYRRAVLGGYPDGEFKGYRSVNRAELAKFLLLARYGKVDELKNNGKFPDVLDGEWYVKYVIKSANLGIIQGYSDGYFRPAQTVNTAEFLKMITLTFGLPENISHNFVDVPANAWYAKYVGIADYYNMFPNRGRNLNPGKQLTRDEVAVGIYQYLKYRNQKDIPKEVEVEAKIPYTHIDYKFKLWFPSTWDGFQSSTRHDIYYGENLKNISAVYFGFDDQKDLFAISVFTHPEWKELNHNVEEPLKPVYLGENKDYVFAYSQSQYTANDEMAARYAEIPEIIKTFSVK